MLSIRNISCGYHAVKVLCDISLSVEQGEILCILGPNGVGKTTLFKAILGFINIMDGEILINQKNISDLSIREKAQTIGYVPQTHNPPFPYKALDVVLMGRTAHLGQFVSPGQQDLNIALQCMETLQISPLRHRVYTELSGGERQLVLIARALAQQPSLLIMDEPTSNLDFGNQIRVLNQISQLAKQGLTIVMTSHFPEHAFLCASKVAILKNDRTAVTGPCDDVVTEKNLREIYRIQVKIAEIEGDDGALVKTCVPFLSE